MSNYSKTTDFEAKDSLPTGDSGKIIRGAEFETEFDAISTACLLYTSPSPRDGLLSRMPSSA